MHKKKRSKQRKTQLQEKRQANALISPDFFGQGISVDISRVFPVVVMATMSCGKSTLINALLGKDILPSRNEACTAKVYSILDNDNDESTTIYLTDKKGTVTKIDSDLAPVLAEANQNPEITSITITGQIKGVLNTKKTLLIIDTPGTNNARDIEHAAITRSVLQKIKGGLILYMINATQMGIHDDRELLVELHSFLEQRPKISVLFVVNKVDALDTERESLEKLMMEIRGYLGNCGFASPNILPLSALSAYLFTKVLNGEVLSRKQRRDFQAAFDLYQPNQMSLVSYAMTDDYPKQYEYVQIDDGEYRVSDIIGAHTNTGIPYLEQYIQQEQIRSAAKQQLRINVNKNKGGKND